MRDLIIGDVHFGLRTNSIEWLSSQLNFFNTQVRHAITDYKPDRVIFLGDVFDIRYALNQQVGIDVKNLFRDFLKEFQDTQFIIIAGNHDYYSMDVKFEEYNVYDLLFGPEFTSTYKNLTIVNRHFLYKDRTLFAPWYWTEEEDRYVRMMIELKNHPIDVIYCHSDLPTWYDGIRYDMKPKDTVVIAGHIHYIQTDSDGLLFNTGSINAKDFNDVNMKKYLYIYDTTNRKFEQAIENVTTPKFLQFTDEEIFTIGENDLKNSYVRFYINNDNAHKARYIEKLEDIKKNYEYLSMKVSVFDTSIEDIKFGGDEFNTNIEEYIEKNIPEYLNKKYNHIKEIIASID